LENETVWQKTHKLGGKIWFAGGTVIVISGILLSEQLTLILFILVTLIITVIPVAYSYIEFKRLQNKDKV